MYRSQISHFVGRFAIAAIPFVLAGSANAADDKTPSSPGLFNFQGTPEEQEACAPDATKFCLDAIPETLRVLACLQEHRDKLRKACQKVLEAHGV